MPSTIKVTLSDGLQAYVESKCGDGGFYETPGEFIRSVIREQMEREEAAYIREAILEGLRDAVEGRMIEYKGSLDDVLKEGERRDRENDW